MAGAALPLAVGSSIFSAGAQIKQGKLEEGEAELAAKQEELAVKQREADRKDRLASALATQNAMAGARGVAAFEGSPLTILQDSLQRDQVATERDAFSSEISARSLRHQGRARSRIRRIGAASSLFRAASLASEG
jgi:hypothetical protein